DERESISADSPRRVLHDDVAGSAKMLKAAGQVHSTAKHLRTHHRHRTSSDTDAAAGIRLRSSGYVRYSLAYLDCRSHRLIGIILSRLPEAETNTDAIPLQLRNFLIVLANDFERRYSNTLRRNLRNAHCQAAE